jgi:uncharacterized protein
MPEYLAPGVYVEEIDTGSKPIEGVSTSTAGIVGVTERGPVGVPMLTTSYGEFERIFGGLLAQEDFGAHRFVPFAVDGFFTNGGKRLFVVRVLDTAAAQRAEFTMHDRGAAGSTLTALLRPAAEGDGDDAIPLYVLDGGAFAAVAADQPFRIGDGSTAEYRLVDTAATPADPNHVALHLPLSRNHEDGTPVRQISAVDEDLPSGNPVVLLEAAPAGSDRILVEASDAGDLDETDATALRAGNLLRIGDAAGGEYRFVTRIVVDADDDTHATVELDARLHLRHEIAEPAMRLNPAPGGADLLASDALDGAARGGDTVVFLGATDPDFDDPSTLLALRNPADTETVEVRRIGDLHQLTLSRAAGAFLRVGTTVVGVTLADQAAPPNRALTRATGVGALAVALNNRSGLEVGDVLRIDTGAATEYVTIEALPDRATGGADPGIALLSHGVRLAHASGAEVRAQDVTASGRPATAVVFDVGAGSAIATVADGTGYAAGDTIRFTTLAGATFHATLGANATDLDPARVSLTAPLINAQPSGAPVAERDPLLVTEALDAGAWGNRLRVSLADEEVGLLASTALDTVLPPRRLRLASFGGVEAGTVLELVDPVSGARAGEAIKVEHVNRTDGTITLRDDLTAEHLNAIAALPAGVPMRVRSREFSLTVRLYRSPDPAVPSRNDTVIDEETFRYLSMDPRHSNYVQTIIGAVDGPPRLSDRRPEGSSRFIRVHDVANDIADPDDRADALREVRLGPEALVDLLPNGRTRAARHPLRGGNDALATINDAAYAGVDAPDPENRSGLHSLRNIDDVSIVAVPGQISVGIQNALISHCELMRYRFAVLDGPTPPNDALADVQAQRQQFDTKYAALYHPWPLISEPFPTRIDDVPMLPIPPSGHVIGIYARTDVERGVHKAPANEVVRGIFSLSRLLTKAEHDLLNPAPHNINVIRDFRPDGRGIRVWGARVITSDPDYKYVPVRRLLIFLEKSIERGLQWVVFEPNAEPLWARVQRSVSDFLRVVWRNGALEGVKEGQAFFVKCDRTTMTQADIDNGRLICLIGVAPVKPAEFVIVRIGLKTAEAES